MTVVKENFKRTRYISKKREKQNKAPPPPTGRKKKYCHIPNKNIKNLRHVSLYWEIFHLRRAFRSRWLMSRKFEGSGNLAVASGQRAGHRAGFCGGPLPKSPVSSPMMNQFASLSSPMSSGRPTLSPYLTRGGLMGLASTLGVGSRGVMRLGDSSARGSIFSICNDWARVRGRDER